MAHQGLRWQMAWDVGFCLCDLAVFLLVHLSSFRFNRYIVLFFPAIFCRHEQNFHLGERNRAAMSCSHRAFGVSPCSTLWIFFVRGFYGFCTIFTWSNLMLCSQIPFFGFFSLDWVWLNKTWLTCREAPFWSTGNWRQAEVLGLTIFSGIDISNSWFCCHFHWWKHIEMTPKFDKKMKIILNIVPKKTWDW